MTITVEMYSKMSSDTMGTIMPIPDAESFLGVLASPGTAFHPNCKYIGVTTSEDDLVAIGPDGNEGTPSLPVYTGDIRWWTVPRGGIWSIVI